MWTTTLQGRDPQSPTPAPPTPPAALPPLPNTDQGCCGLTCVSENGLCIYDEEPCTDDDESCIAGPSVPSTTNDGVNYYMDAQKFEQHRLILETFAEHVLSNWPGLGWIGGTVDQRNYMIGTFVEVPRAIFLALIGDSNCPSPSRLSVHALAAAPAFAAADVAEALLHIKDRFDKTQWWLITNGWFVSWTGVSLEKALCDGLGRDGVEDGRRVTGGSDQRRRIFRAWSQVEPEYADDAMKRMPGPRPYDPAFLY
ncbi:hypothetical protein Dda_5201 [Drechslerella dactyloides]|uniref:Uncharacterized protein n=1 Tax=Drechslerella dactyloides TaxID=74499 RepID=A0AAD6IX42_DREDA|nr:hypothetical protein Dda_5201 [Drechslerella dactyloides]